MHRKTAMKVQGGRALKKNNWRRDRDDLWIPRPGEVRVVREAPAPGSRHLVTVPQLRAFLERLPMWDEVAVGLRAVVLSGDDDAMGWHDTGVIGICGWERELWWEDTLSAFHDEHEWILDRLGVDRERAPDGEHWIVRWTEEQARDFQLLHILPHELGHHRDRMTTRATARAARGEPYAERYAREVFELLAP
jgi:hypothetical protein